MTTFLLAMDDRAATYAGRLPAQRKKCAQPGVAQNEPAPQQRAEHDRKQDRKRAVVVTEV
jgi:hypothetical protein